MRVMSVTGLLDARGQTHGRFEDNARVGQHLRAFWRSQPAWASMPEVQREALDHMAGKLSRIFSGQSTHFDHWADLAGYAELARKACPQPEPPLVSTRHGFMDAAGNWVNAPYEG
jgi:hypothetical protein